MRYYRPKLNRNLEVIARKLSSTVLLVALLATPQGCHMFGSQDNAAKDRVVVALNELVVELSAERPTDASSYTVYLRRYLEANPTFYGAAAALLDENEDVIASPYVYRTADGFQIVDLAAPDYDIENQEWFAEPLAKDKGIWTDPYFDAGGGEIWMITYAVPARDADRIYAILTTDLPSNNPAK